MRKEIFASGDAILMNESDSNLLSGTVDAPSATVDADGNKYIKAGTLLTADKPFATSNQGVVLVPTTDPTKAQGVLLHHVNVVDGAKATAVVVEGTLNKARMEKDVADVYSDANITSLKAVLPRITVVDRY